MDTWMDKQNVVYNTHGVLHLHAPIYICCPSSLYLQKHENMIHKWFHWHLILSLSKEKCCDCLEYQVQALCTFMRIFLTLSSPQWMQGLPLFMKTEMISVINTDFFARHYWGRHVINRSHDSYSPWNYENNSFQTLTITYSKNCIYESHSEYILHVFMCVCL